MVAYCWKGVNPASSEQECHVSGHDRRTDPRRAPARRRRCGVQRHHARARRGHRRRQPTRRAPGDPAGQREHREVPRRPDPSAGGRAQRPCLGSGYTGQPASRPCRECRPVARGRRGRLLVGDGRLRGAAPRPERRHHRRRHQTTSPARAFGRGRARIRRRQGHPGHQRARARCAHRSAAGRRRSSPRPASTHSPSPSAARTP